ncbi:MAG: L-2-amino-thiazoline-4-carboxylic acid hydrolase [Christensenellaceae bacterium]|nr:L-2-amino-thiazoline-4-carboxylic acid hydrolase [Christensenellaceae bacterium]
MAFDNNVPSIRNFAVDGMREISGRRADTIGNMIDEAKQEGISDDFARRAIGKYGSDNGKRMRDCMDDPDSFDEFRRIFGTDHNHDVYEMETVKNTEDELEIHFHYCPYVAAWEKQGRSPEEIAHLCDVTMEGDRELAKVFPFLSFELRGTIAEGCPVCCLHFDRVR